MLKLNDFYKNKDNHSVIQIDSFANSIDSSSDALVIFRCISDFKKFSYCFSGPKYYATKEYILENYVLVEQTDSLFKFNDLNNILTQ